MECQCGLATRNLSVPGAFLGFADGGGGSEARRAESRGGVFGEGAASQLPTS